jgi:hypothetical protein
MNESQLRIEELERNEEPLTHEELLELISLKPSRTFVDLPNASTLGITDLDKQIRNLKERHRRIYHALSSGCFIEVIVLRVQYIEIWLRMYWVVQNNQNQIFSPTGPGSRKTFGSIIDGCEKCGFRSDLIDRLRKFNTERNNALHKYFLGDTDYAALEQVCKQTAGLDREVEKYVVAEIGRPTSLDPRAYT